MNTLRNTVNLIGNLGKDPVMTAFGKDNALARFSVATNEKFQNKKGQWETKTTWHSIVAWGETAKRCENLLRKGSEIILEGKLVNDSYETKEGEKRYATEVHLRQFIVVHKENNPLKVTSAK